MITEVTAVFASQNDDLNRRQPDSDRLTVTPGSGKLKSRMQLEGSSLNFAVSTKHLPLLSLLAISFLLGGCFSTFSPAPAPPPTQGETVTLTGTVTTQAFENGTVKNAFMARSASMEGDGSPSTANIPVNLYRVAWDGTREPLFVGKTDEKGEFRFAGVPNYAHIVIEAELTMEDEDEADEIKLESTVVTIDDTRKNVNPLYHVTSKVAENDVG